MLSAAGPSRVGNPPVSVEVLAASPSLSTRMWPRSAVLLREEALEEASGVVSGVASAVAWEATGVALVSFHTFSRHIHLAAERTLVCTI